MGPHAVLVDVGAGAWQTWVLLSIHVYWSHSLFTCACLNAGLFRSVIRAVSPRLCLGFPASCSEEPVRPSEARRGDPAPNALVLVWKFNCQYESQQINAFLSLMNKRWGAACQWNVLNSSTFKGQPTQREPWSGPTEPPSGVNRFCQLRAHFYRHTQGLRCTSGTPDMADTQLTTWQLTSLILWRLDEFNYKSTS